MAEENNHHMQEPDPQEAVQPNNGPQIQPLPVAQPAEKSRQKPELALIGQEISGCVILEKVSEGGMGTVFRAKHKALDRIVCVKVLSPSLADDKKAVGLFLTEARAIAEIDHPNIVFVYNVGKEKGFYFIVMSFIEGESLSSIVRKKPNLPISFVVETFIGILRGLEAAHQKGIIHRDIKPSNILINRKLEPKIVDFGIAKKVDKEKGCTKTTELAGTAYFLSPEQALGRAIDTRADLYSVGASLFYVLTGKYPFTGKNSMEIIQKHINEVVPDISKYRKNIPPWLIMAIAKLMSKNPKDRFQTADDTLIYFQKMRADEQLKVSQGVNITEEVGLRISTVDMGTSPRVDEVKPKIKSNRFNMSMDAGSPSASARSSIPIVTLGDRAKGGAEVTPAGDNPDKSTTQRFIEARKKQLFSQASPREIDPTKALNAKKNKFLVKGFLLTVLSTFLMVAAAGIFLKLGALCSAYNIADMSLTKAILAPWVTGEFLPGQMPLAAVGFVLLIFTLSMMFFDLINKIVPVVIVIAVWSYIAGLFGLAQSDSMLSLASHGYLLIYAFVLGAWAIKIDDVDQFPLLYRLGSIFMFGLGFLCIFNFSAPAHSVQGELTTSLFYSTLGLAAATFVLPFLRGSYIFRLAAVLLFVAGCSSIWVYQASGNTYYIMQQIYAPVVEEEAMPEAELIPGTESAEPQYEMENFTHTAVQVNTLNKSEFTPNLAAADPSVGDEEEYISTANEAAAIAKPADEPEAEKEEIKKAEPQLAPEEAQAAFIKKMQGQAKTMDKVEVERVVWSFALREPFETLKYNYKQEGFIFFSIVAMIIYGIFMFIIAVLAAREERWNLI